MLKRILSVFDKTSSPSGKAGSRAYAIGDIHGRLDLLNLLLERIEQDMAQGPDIPTHVIFLGDLIDRGPDSRGVIERAIAWSALDARKVFLLGNHEEMLLEILGGREGLVHEWLKFGGAECLKSYGVNPLEILALDAEAAARMLLKEIPRAHVKFLQSFADTFRFGDYLFVHAGIRPGVPIEAQIEHDLRWIRGDFLADTRDHGVVVVHGHTISDGVDERSNRIGIDTGAYSTGILTAITVEGAQRRFISTGRSDHVAGGGPIS